MSYIYAFRSAFLEQLRSDLYWDELLLFVITHVPLAAVLAWIASNGSDAVSGPDLESGSGFDSSSASASVPIGYLFVGVLLMSIWNRVSIRIGWAITGDILVGTYDYVITSRTPLAVIILGRALALSGLGIFSGLFPLLVIVWIWGQFIHVSEPLLLVFGALAGAFSVLSVAVVFAPLFLLVRGREGFFNVIRPLGVVLGGFLYPVAFLAPGIEFLARIFPVAWAMDAVILGLRAEGSLAQGARDLGISLLISLAYLALTWLLLVRVERRVRVDGNTRAF